MVIFAEIPCGFCINLVNAALPRVYFSSWQHQIIYKPFEYFGSVPEMDVLGMESDDTRYDARKYEDPNYRKIKGVSGYDVYKHDKKIQKLEDEIDELERKIAMESDTKKINKYQKQIEDDREEIEIILQELDSEDSKGTRTKELYTKKIANAGEGEVSDAQMNKGIQFVRANDKDLMIVRKCLSNQ